jgi:hypothetical protein
MHASTYRSAAALALAAALGCGGAPALPTGPATPPAASTPAPEEKPIVAGVPGEKLPENEIPVTDIPRKFTAKDPIKGRRTRQDAKEGANVGGISSMVAGGLYAQHQQIIQSIDYANELYNPQHDFSYPKTQEEFMRDVVALALNGIPLPEIPADQEYCYVPAQGKIGLQIRLVPGSPNSKVPAGTTPEQAIEMLGGSLEPEEPAYVPPTTQISPPPGEQPAADPAADPAAAAPGEPEGGRDDAGNPLDLRERAAGFGGVSPTDGLSE